MSNLRFDDILSSLQTEEDSSKILKLLVDTRKHVDWPIHRDNIHKLRDSNGLKKIVSYLSTSKKAVLDVCLSILGNCCMEHKCARDAVCQLNILSTINQILKRYPKEDSINGRVFRILGNIFNHKDTWVHILMDKKPQIIIQIVAILKNASGKDENVTSISEATITMAIRFLRVIVNAETVQELVSTYHVLQAVGMLLIKYGTKWQETKQKENILNNIIRLLLEYSRYRYYPSIQQLRTTEKGDSIVYLSNILLVAPEQVVKIVMNFLAISQLKSDLPIPEIFNSFIEVLQDTSLINEFNYSFMESIKCLCRLLDHPGNRKNDRCGASIPILINILKGLSLDTNNKVKCCVLIISTLKKCRYNEELVADQVKYNIISVLNEKIITIVGCVEPFSIAHKGKKRRNETIGYKKSKRCRLFGDFFDNRRNEEELNDDGNDDYMDHLYYSRNLDLSPSSESEVSTSWTSGLSPQSSPRKSETFGFSDSDSDDYSPVCSEVDPSELLSAMGDGLDFLDTDLDRSTDDVSENNDELPGGLESDCNNLNKTLIVEIVDLLKTYVRMKPPIPQLGSCELLLGLIKSSACFDWPRSSAILEIAYVVYDILEKHDFLVSLMETNFIPYIANLTKMQHGAYCSKCRHFQWMSGSAIKTLSNVAESEAGKGDIAHKLLRGDLATKQKLVLVIPYIIRNKSILMKLMLNCGGLEVLMKLLQEETEQQKPSVQVLCVLASKKLRIHNPRNVQFTTEAPTTSTDCHSNQPEEIVTFILDDNSCLEAKRNLLSHNSDYFRSLLNGSFKESKQDVIELPNVTNKSLGFLLHLIEHGFGNDGSTIFDADLNTLLDVITLCDRFLMPNHCHYLVECVQKFRLHSDAVPTIYNWSLESRTNFLRVECIAFALVANIIDSERFEMFKNLFELGYNEKLVDDIKKLLVRYMTISQLCDCKNNFCDSNCKNFDKM